MGLMDDLFHPVQHEIQRKPRTGRLQGIVSQGVAQGGVIQQPGEGVTQGGGIFGWHQQAGDVILHDLFDASHRCGNDRYAAGHGLHQRLRYPLAGVGWQGKQITRLQPWDHIVLVSRHGQARGNAVFLGEPGELGPLGTIAHEQQVCIRALQGGESLQEMEVSFPVAQRGHNADDLSRLRESQGASIDGLGGGHKMGQIDPGGHRGDPFGGKAVVLDQRITQCFAGGDHVIAPLGVEPASGRVARHRGGDMTHPDDGWPAWQQPAGDSDQPTVCRTVGDDEIHRMLFEPAVDGPQTAHMFAADGDGLDGDTAGLCGLEQRCLNGTEKGKRIPPVDQAGGFRQGADLLAAPPHGGFGMHDAQGHR